MIKTFLSREALVAAYWRKLARSIEAARGGVFARRASRALRTRRGRSRGNGAAKGIAARQAAH